MANARDHYEHHLAPVYLWMAGGFDAALARGEADIAAVAPDVGAGTVAVDLGAGFGTHAIPLGRRGCSVLAVDSSSLLLEQLRERAAGLPVRAIEDDLTSFERHLDGKADLVLCMGDTLTHLPEPASVTDLFASAARSLRPGGRFVASFRDYTSPLVGERRFIPVLSHADRILTCFLEYGSERVTVHDLLHEREGDRWELRVSAYPKLRLAPRWVADALDAAGFEARVEAGPAGMVRVVGTR